MLITDRNHKKHLLKTCSPSFRQLNLEALLDANYRESIVCCYQVGTGKNLREMLQEYFI